MENLDEALDDSIDNNKESHIGMDMQEMIQSLLHGQERILMKITEMDEKQKQMENKIEQKVRKAHPLRYHALPMSLHSRFHCQ